MTPSALMPVALGILGLISAFLVFLYIKKAPAGEGRLKEISDQIHLGAMVFMNSEYRILAVFCAVCIAAIGLSDLGLNTALAFLLGAVCSGSAGYWGMYTATHANVRTAVAANSKGAAEALNEYRKHKHLLSSSKALAELTPRQHSGAGFPPKSSHRHKNRPSCHRIRPKVAATGARQKSCLTDRWQCDSCLCT